MSIKLSLGNPETGKTYKMELNDEQTASLRGKTIGSTFDGESIGLPGYKITITGGSSKTGFVMKKDLQGPAKRRILAATGIGFKPKIKGQRRRKFIYGNEISVDTIQVNAKIAEYGPKSVERLLGLEPEEEEAEEETEATEEAEE